jgi:hypothetical protein
MISFGVCCACRSRSGDVLGPATVSTAVVPALGAMTIPQARPIAVSQGVGSGEPHSKARISHGYPTPLDPPGIGTFERSEPIRLCLSSDDLGPGLVLEEAPDSACDVALEAATDLAVGLAFGASSVAVVAGGLVVVGSGDRDDEEGVVELPVAAAVEAVTVLALARRCWQRCNTSEASEGGLVAASPWV